MPLVSVGVSGGVDSAATVLMLKNQGFSVKGVHFSVLSENNSDYISKLSESLEIDIIECNVSKIFDKNIVTPFISDYMSGRTPSPCVECNPMIKWSVVRSCAEQIGASVWATGHYARVVKQNGFYYVARGADILKDQSYYLWKLDQQTLAGALMPLGSYSKVEIKKYMENKGFMALSHQKESMGVCFLGPGGYKELLRERVPDIHNLCGGEIVDRTGKVVGTHDGYPFYTIAQHRRLGIDKGLCVVEIDKANNRLVIGDENELYVDNFFVENYQFINRDEIAESGVLEVKVRGVGRNPVGYCKVDFVDDKLLRVSLLTSSAWAIANGQPAVFYIKERVVGGGYLKL
ncbi:MAG: tRNA 2-thiouridine(34) synthase MnmA [Rikenellaceae bacterium]